MRNEYPFTDLPQEIAPRIPGLYVSNNIENLTPSFKLGKREMVDLIGEEMWDIAIKHYNDETNYNIENESDSKNIRLNKLVSKIQDAMIMFTYYHHFIWLMLKISDSGIKLNKEEGTQIPYKYMTDEGKGKLLETAWESINDLINFLNKEATYYTTWKKEKEYTKGTHIKIDDKYYECTTNHISDIFSNEIGNWELKENMIFPEWIASEQFTETMSLMMDYKDFDKIYSIDKSAYFFIKARHLISEVIEDDILPRFEGFRELEQEFRKGKINKENKSTHKKMSRAIVYLTMTKACLRFDYYQLPKTMRNDFNNEMTIRKSNKNQSEETIKEKIALELLRKGEKYLYDFEKHLDSQKEIDVTNDFEELEVIQEETNYMDESDGFVFM